MKKLVFASALAIGSLTMGTAATPIIFHDGIMEENTYKLEVSIEDGTSIELYTETNGNWLEI